MSDHGAVLLRVETEVDRDTVARRVTGHMRRAPRPSDRWWALGIGVFALVGWAATGPSLLWYLGLSAAGLFLIGDLLERRAISRELHAIPEQERHRVVEVAEGGVSVSTTTGAPISRAPWSEVDDVVRRGDVYTIVIRDEPFEVPLHAFPSELARGSFEAVAARNDRPVRHGGRRPDPVRRGGGRRSR